MKNPPQLLFLGTGGSMGVPVIGCTCPVCKSQSSYNQRLRTSVLLTVGGKTILIDCGPDFRVQALKHGITDLDGVLFTHAHYDHTAGIDELRIFSFKRDQPIPTLLSQETLDDVQKRFEYIFASPKKGAQPTTKFELHIIPQNRGKVLFEGLEVKYFTYSQMGMNVNGYRLGNLAYVSDIKKYPETIFEDLAGVEILILSALRFIPSPMHFDVDEAIDFAQKIGAKQTWLTHIAHELDHEKTNAYLPPEIRLAYDGLILNFNLNG